jgi:hypothetical protein
VVRRQPVGADEAGLAWIAKAAEAGLPLIRFKPRKNWLPRSPAIACFSVS